MNNNSLKRIQKEYKDIIKNPIEHILTKPNPDNLYIWHYVIKGHIEPYKNGYYYGIITLPKEYPLKPPKIIMITPNGRFKTDTRLCFSMSDYHIETWNPNWNIRTILIGFYSFMLEESTTQGSIESSYNERLLLSKESLDFNRKITIFNEIFDTLIFKTTINDTNIEKKCRFCFETNEPLISVCQCKGTNKWIHEECLKEWQLYTIINQSTHPQYQVASDKICCICNTEYLIKSKSREELMKELTGNAIIKQLKCGYIFISSETSSKENIKLMETYKDIELHENLLNWTYGVFLIVEHNNNGVIAINTNRNINKSNKYELYLKIYENYIKQFNINNIINKNIFIGGPCDINSINAIIVVDSKINIELINIKIINKIDDKILLFGQYKDIYNIYQKYNLKTNLIHIFIGYAGWSITQLHSEFAKTNWGVTNINFELLFKINNYESIDKKKCLFVKSNIYSENKHIEN